MKINFSAQILQGISSGFDIMYLALADRNMQVRFGLKVGWESLFRCFEKINFWINSWNFSEILHSLRTEAVEDRDVTFNQIKGS